ncbi:hypothetical protein DFH27DRAFT_574176 [Peziza echinospora]|nr:hypothetical protein DFH27DRAFT_574176 [Peziza echinospora]
MKLSLSVLTIATTLLATAAAVPLGPTINGPILNDESGPILNDESGPVLNTDGPVLNVRGGPVLQCSAATHPCALYSSLPLCSPAWHAMIDLCIKSGCIQWIRNPKEDCPPVPTRGEVAA